jgi:hypothetical protein
LKCALSVLIRTTPQREDLNPTDQAKGILELIQVRHPDKNYNLDGVISDLVSYNRSPKYVSESFSSTVEEKLKIVRKSITTLFNVISLLKLVPKIQDVIFSGKLPVSQGYSLPLTLEVLTFLPYLMK